MQDLGLTAGQARRLVIGHHDNILRVPAGTLDTPATAQAVPVVPGAGRKPGDISSAAGSSPRLACMSRTRTGRMPASR